MRENRERDISPAHLGSTCSANIRSLGVARRAPETAGRFIIEVVSGNGTNTRASEAATSITQRAPLRKLGKHTQFRTYMRNSSDNTALNPERRPAGKGNIIRSDVCSVPRILTYCRRKRSGEYPVTSEHEAHTDTRGCGRVRGLTATAYVSQPQSRLGRAGQPPGAPSSPPRPGSESARRGKVSHSKSMNGSILLSAAAADTRFASKFTRRYSFHIHTFFSESFYPEQSYPIRRRRVIQM